MPARPWRNMVWSSASSTLIGPFVIRFSPIPPDALRWCVRKALYRLRHFGPRMFAPSMSWDTSLRCVPQVRALFTGVRGETVWKVAVRVEWHVLWQREAPNKVPFRTVVQAKGATKWSPFGLSRQSLEGVFSEVRSLLDFVTVVVTLGRQSPCRVGT